MAGIFQFFTALLAKISNFAKWFIACFKQVFIDLWHMVTDLVCWGFDGFLSIAAGAISLINVPFDPQHYYSMIPAELTNALGLIGFPQAMAMIVASLVIRFLLQTIPFVRWGS